MKEIDVKVIKKVSVPTTARDWQLYRDNPDAAAAAKDLTSAFEAAIGAMSANDALNCYQAFTVFVYPIMEQWQHVGAADTEPRQVAMSTLRSIFGRERE